MNPDLHTDDDAPKLNSDEIRMLRSLLKGYINGTDSVGVNIRKARTLEQKLWAMQ